MNKITQNLIVERVDGPNDNGWYDITFESGERAATKNEELAKAAFQSRGSEVPVVMSTRVSGKFTNVYLNEIDGMKDTPKKGARKAPATVASGGFPRDNERIARQWAYGRAVELLIGSEQEFSFPLDSATMSQVSEVATALLNATRE